MSIKRIQKSYIGYFLIYVIALLTIAGVYLWLENEQDAKLHSSKDQAPLEQVSLSIQRELEGILPGISQLARNATVLEYLKKGDIALYRQLIAQFQTFAEQKRIYSRLRILDNTGQERLRVEYRQGKAKEVEQDKLQDKSKPYYFHDLIGLKAGELFISPMVLNADRDKSAGPYDPVLHIATPVVDQNSQTHGIILLNYLAKPLLRHFDEMLVGSAGHVALLNDQANWLRSHQKERVFGKLMSTLVLALILGMLAIAIVARVRPQHGGFQSQLELHAMLYASTTEGVLITDDKGNIIEVNDAFQEITHYSREDVIGHSPSILSSGHQDKEFYKHMWSDLNTKGVWEGEITNRRKDGTLIVEWLRIYVIKDENGKVANNIAVFSDITSKKLSEEEMLHRAHHDPLTGLANRLSFDECLQQDLARARRNEHNLALLFIDLDRFKDINDTYGHHFGDEVLLEVARRLLKELREVDAVARIGGDEFVVILAELSELKNIDVVTKRILQSLRQVINVNQKELHISASIGISLFPYDGQTERELIANADKAMYEVKRNYRDGYGYYSSLDAVDCEKSWPQVK